MKQVSLDALGNELAKPGFERELIPLLMYRGSADLGRYHRLWNLVVAMMMHECESVSEGINHMHLKAEWSHLCYPVRPVQMSSMCGFFIRLLDNKPVTDMVTGLTDYVRWVAPMSGNYAYERIPLEATRSRAAWWRAFTPKPRGKPLLEMPFDFMSVAPDRSLSWLCSHYGHSDSVIRRWHDQSGLPRPKWTQRIELPEDFREVAFGLTVREIVEHYGYSTNTIRRWLDETGITPVPGRNVERFPVPDDFFEMAAGKSLQWAVRHYGRSQRVITRWFEESGAERGSQIINRALAYPFLLHEARRPEHELLRIINEAIPAHLPPELRADMCQDLAVGILTGDFNKDDLYLPAKEVAKRVYRMFPTKYGPISLDAPLSYDSEFSILDTLVDQGRDWA